MFINDWVYLDAAGGTITLEENIHLAQRATVLTSIHSIGEQPELRCGEPEASSTTIGQGSWVGAGAIILPGANVAPGCVIVAGAVVTRLTPPNGLYAVVPARRIKDLPV
ncbi:acyltransferase [Rothia terrae]|uniref:acyltransferase n=1 Tax=Rothia terrae TaxID=396015 RepID=UPI0033E96933